MINLGASSKRLPTLKELTNVHLLAKRLVGNVTHRVAIHTYPSLLETAIIES